MDTSKLIDNLATIIQTRFSLDRFLTSLLMFFNRRRNKIKMFE
ncbi:IS66 family insertion sequence element accessory protein TnpB [Acetivibrio clariflavus]